MEPVRAALVVAADEFADPKFQRLRAPAKDAEALAAVLGDGAIGGFAVRRVVNQPGPVVQQELERFFSDRRPDDLLLLYFSCHGVKDAAGRLYFVTSDTSFDLLRSTGISATFVSEQMEYSRSKRIVVLLDCCYSGAFLKGFRARGDDSVAVDTLQGRGRAVITASRATEYAFEADELTSDHGEPSMFTGAIVSGLATGSADRNGDGLVTVDELYDYVYDDVRTKVSGQTPGRWVDVEGDLVVARNPRPPARPVTVVTSAGPEVPAALPAVPPAAPAPVTAAPVELPPDRGERVAGAMAVAGGLAIAVAPHLPFIRFDGWSSQLSEREWFSLGAFALFGLLAYGGWSLLRSATSRTTGLVVLAGLLPVAIGDGLVAAGELVHGSDVERPGAGWVLHELGLLLAAAAGLFAVARLRRHVSVSSPFAPGRGGGGSPLVPALLGAAALVVGATAALGWARVLQVTGDGFLDLAPAVPALVARLLVVTLVIGLAGPWVRARAHGWPRGTQSAVAAAAYLGPVALYLDANDASWWAYVVGYVVLALGSVLVPLLATAVMPARLGVALLAAWIGGSAVWIPVYAAGDGAPDVLALSLAAAAGLLALLRVQRTTPASRSEAIAASP